MYVKTTLKKMKITRSPKEIVAGAGTHDKREGDIVDEIYSTPSSTLDEEGRTVKSKRVRKMAHLHFIYDVKMKRLARTHVLGAKQDVDEKGNFI